ncbi:MAG: hypothetical protein MUC63_06095, partial [Planctomycetes bacterium]|nr:hypothetical protein [Planctomycetota bacterium]
MSDEPKPPPAPETPPAAAPAPAPAPAERLVVVRYGKIIERRVFVNPLESLGPGEACVVRTNRGTEYGRIVEPAPPTAPEDIEGRVL